MDKVMDQLVFQTKFDELTRFTSSIRDADRLVDEALALYDDRSCTDRAALMVVLRRLEIVAHRYAKDVRLNRPSTGISAAAIKLQLDEMRRSLDRLFLRMGTVPKGGDRGEGGVEALEAEVRRQVCVVMTTIAIFLNDIIGSPSRLVG